MALTEDRFAVKKLVMLLVFLGVILAGGAYWINHSHSSEISEDAYTLAPIEWGSMSEVVSATGILKPQEVLAASSEVSGKVVEIFPGAEINKDVEEGQALLKLDDTLSKFKLDQAKIAVRHAQAGVQAAEANRDAAEIRVTTLRNLVKGEVAQKRDLDEAEMKYKAAMAAVVAAKVGVEEAEKQEELADHGLKLTVVRAPFSSKRRGNKRILTILEAKVVRGQLIAPPASANLFTLATDLNQMKVHAQVSENDVGKVRIGMPVTFTTYAYSEDVRFRGEVTEIGQMASDIHGARFYETVIDVNNQHDTETQDRKLRPGMSASVDIILREHMNVWKVPTAALSFQLDEHYQTEPARAKVAQLQKRKDHDDWRTVWIIRDGKPWPIFVRLGGKNTKGETGISDGQYNEVLEWDADLGTTPDARAPATVPQVITSAPPVGKRGLFSGANVKLF
jgi:HlyD family secretion protein